MSEAKAKLRGDLGGELAKLPVLAAQMLREQGHASQLVTLTSAEMLAVLLIDADHKEFLYAAEIEACERAASGGIGPRRASIQWRRERRTALVGQFPHRLRSRKQLDTLVHVSFSDDGGAGWKAQYPLDLHFSDIPTLAEAHAHELYDPFLKLPPATPKMKGRPKRPEAHGGCPREVR
ncbi:hypothetical protein CYMTET_5982 [Cymbomonas tetramitiformis]|uniref:Uncharacterized protein n=1 Tax=Cymbomonas tetramitiformis TaxID=36881 RepID=A0AAE0GY11_9CHLO|nr:hypothetical protein CYMTET_5982 [Cymbomonas tetramitiformis]